MTNINGVGAENLGERANSTKPRRRKKVILFLSAVDLTALSLIEKKG